MATIRKERTIEVSPEEVWAVLADWGAPHERLVPGFVVATELDGEDRLVTFFNGAVARERLIERSEEERRLVWSIVDGPYTHHNGPPRSSPTRTARPASSGLPICCRTRWRRSPAS